MIRQPLRMIVQRNDSIDALLVLCAYGDDEITHSSAALMRLCGLSEFVKKHRQVSFSRVSAFIGCKMKYAGNTKNIQKVEKRTRTCMASISCVLAGQALRIVWSMRARYSSSDSLTSCTPLNF